jgi:hypothetical protein
MEGVAVHLTRLRGLISVARPLDVPRILPQAGRQAPLAMVTPAGRPACSCRCPREIRLLLVAHLYHEWSEMRREHLKCHLIQIIEQF